MVGFNVFVVVLIYVIIAISSESVRADVDAAETFVDEFNKIIEEGGYLPEQIFNVVESVLFGKKNVTAIIHPQRNDIDARS